MGDSSKINYVSAIYVNDGAYLPEKSTVSAVVSGKPGDSSASGIKITSKAGDFGGLYVKGKSSYTLSDSTIDLHGNGSNDFYGLGSGAMADKGATLILRNVKITTNGVITPTTTAMANSTLKVYNSTLVANGGELPKDYMPRIGPGMMEPPAPLGITGTARATLTMNGSESYFYHSTIIADGWGALSTDMASGHVYLEANDCDVKTVKSGYGLYADGGAIVVINDSRMNTATYTGILAGSGKVTLNNVDATSAVNAFMIHNVVDGSQTATLEINGGRYVTDKQVVLVKSANAEISMAGASISSKSSVLLQSIVNTDKNTAAVKGQPAGVRATFKQMNLDGDILHEDPSRAMYVTFLSTVMKGAIRGAQISLDASSKWTATEDSNVVLAAGVEVDRIDAPTGVTITATAAEGSALHGSYKLAGGGVLNVN
jgi:hypothetical protein